MSDIEDRIEGLLSQNYQVGSKEYWQARAEAAEKERDEFRRALDRGLPAILVTVGDRWLNADSGTVYEWDGTAWVQVRSDG